MQKEQQKKMEKKFINQNLGAHMHPKTGWNPQQLGVGWTAILCFAAPEATHGKNLKFVALRKFQGVVCNFQVYGYFVIW